MSTPGPIARALEILSVGLPFCVFKLLSGRVLLTMPGYEGLGYALIALGSIDVVLNVFALAAGGLTHATLRPVCLAEWIVRRAGRGASSWRRLGLSIDVMLAFTLVAVMVGAGGILRLSQPELRLWNLCVVLNVLGAGLGRLAESVSEVRTTNR